ncbi:MAG: 23S rRNA (uracil(1939)-C(5))-methyltransferase RlmD [Pseudomonadota bacterium]|nr:23S rRNA (uracil(1939)-C(5))-methyltransferase RlmD [Pseudomonadota bacterium]
MKTNAYLKSSYTINSINSDIMGVTTKNKKKLLVRGALPGEEVTLINLAKKKGKLIATADEVVNPNSLRIKAKCEYSKVCGGCSLQHLSSSTQLELKQKEVQRQLYDFAGLIDVEFMPAITANTWGYRRKARLGVRYVAKKDRYLVGFREFNTSFLTDMETCDILVPQVGQKLRELSELISKLSIANKIPQIEVTAADNATALLFRHLEEFNTTDLRLLQDFGKTHNFQIYLQADSYVNSKMIYPQQSEPLYYILPKYDLKLLFKVYDFIQVNSEINMALIAQALAWLELSENDHVLEGFCGIGNFSLPIAKYAASVTAIENCTSLLEDARQNAILNKLSNIDFLADDLYNCKQTSSYFANTKFTKLFLDPPRSGAGPWLPTALSTQPETIVYVSCHSASLAKDAAILKEAGYNLTKIAIADMFPHTNHVETIAQFKYQG